MKQNMQYLLGFITISVILTVLGMGLFARPENLAQAEIRIYQTVDEKYVSKDSFSLTCQTMQEMRQDIKEVKSDMKTLLRKR